MVGRLGQHEPLSNFLLAGVNGNLKADGNFMV